MTYKPRQKSRPLNIGALWRRIDKKGKDYFFGRVDINGVRTNIVVFLNTFRKGSKEPTHVIKEDQIRELIENDRQYHWEE